MPIIQKLSPQVADMIAAGEVVERPASVVKELCENAIDAGARSITVELRRGGMSFLRVTDDGVGMSPEDAPTAFLRHATSKIRDERGLEAIHTLGFRGEALAAIASVSRVELTTRERGSASGCTVTLEGGVDVGGGAVPSGCPEGTTIIARDLFFNTPARFKFMKTDSAEGSAAVNAALRCALSHPELAFRVIKDGDEMFRTSGSGDIKDCAYALLGREITLNLTEIPESGDDTMKVRGLISSPSGVRGNRGGQYFFVNNRHVKSQLLTAALEQAYRTLIPNGRFPSCVLYLTLRANSVDVNVHPAKTEIKFLYERAVFDLVHYAVKSYLLPQTASKTVQPVPAIPESPIKQEIPIARQTQIYTTPREPTVAPVHKPLPERNVNEHQQVIQELFAPPARAHENVSVPMVNVTAPEAEINDYRIIGEAYGGYVIAELPTELLFIDKHAAHERILFDKLKSKEFEAMPQLLITPLILEPGVEDSALVLENLAILEPLGFSVDDFGGGALAVRQIPSQIELGDVSALINELVDNIRNGNRPGSLGRTDEILSTIACKAAIKLGRSSDLREFAPLVEAVISGAVTHCPHGRPITFRLPKEQLEKAIKRK